MKKIDPNRPVAYMGTIIVAILSIVQAEKRILPMAAGILLLVLNFALTPRIRPKDIQRLW